MSTLDERRSKRRRKAADDKQSTATVAEATTPDASATGAKSAADSGASSAQGEAATAGAAATAGSDAGATAAPETGRRSAEKTPQIESINFAAYLRHAVTQSPDQRALAVAQKSLAGDVTWTHATLRDLDERSDALARGFLAAGWARGQRVLVLSEPSVDALTSVLALVKLGAVPVLIEPGRSREDIVACAEQALASVVLASPAGLLKRFIARGPLKNAKTTVLIGAELPVPVPGVKALSAYRSAETTKVVLAPTRPAEPALIMFSTGSSGTSRAVVLDHASLIAQAESLRRSQGLNPGEVVLCSDLLLAMLLVVLGKTVVMPGAAGKSAKNVERLVACLDQYAVTTVFGPPPQWRAVADHCTRIGRMLPNVRQVLLVGGPASLATHASIQAVLPSGECRSIYGMTEAFPIASIASRDALSDARAVTERGGGQCLGRILPGVEAAVLDFGRGGGVQVEPGELGEICIKGARVALSEARAAGPWTRTGDIGWTDRQGRLWTVGSVRRSAHTRFGPIYNGAGEALFEMHPRVQRAVIVALGQPGAQEAVLVVQPAEGKAPKDDSDRLELERELLHAAESHQVTRGIRRVVFKKELPLDARWGAQVSARDLSSSIEGGSGH